MIYGRIVDSETGKEISAWTFRVPDLEGPFKSGADQIIACMIASLQSGRKQTGDGGFVSFTNVEFIHKIGPKHSGELWLREDSGPTFIIGLGVHVLLKHP